MVLKIFYLNDGKLKKPEALIFLLTNFAIPLSFIAGGAYLLTGKLFWHTTIGWLIMAAAVVGLSGLGLAFVNQTKNRLTPTMILAVWFAIIGCLLPLKISHGGSLASGPILGLTILGFVGLMGLVIDSIKTNRRLVLLTAGLVGLGTPLLLAWSNRPYLIHQQITLAGAYSAAAYAGIFIVSLVIMLPLLILGGILFYKLLKIQAKS